MTDEKFVLVFGATGNQGGAVARHLLERGWAVHALARDPDKPAARELAERGASLVAGDLDDEDSLRKAMAGAYGVFSVQPLLWQVADPSGTEVRQGIAVADIAHEAAVQHLVYSSVGGAERSTGIDHFETKAAIEQHIADIGIPATVLRPVFFMENLLGLLAGAESDPDAGKVLALPVDPATKVQMIASDDIGRIAAYAFDHPSETIGTATEIAGDEVTLAEAAGLLSGYAGTPVRYRPQDFAGRDRMFEWFDEGGYQVADLEDLRRRFPALLTLGAFLQPRASVQPSRL